MGGKAYIIGILVRDQLRMKNGPQLFDSDQATNPSPAIHHHPHNPRHTLCKQDFWTVFIYIVINKL